MELLRSLGVNSTFWIQVGCFIVSFLSLTQLVFKPYLRAHHEREKRTVGNEETATRLIQEATDLHHQYEQRAKTVNSQIKSAFDASRGEAQKEYDVLVQNARQQAQSLIEESRQALSTQIQAARKQLSADIPSVSVAIASRLAGKDLSQ
jgi:F0F1-type ATP synthase membrane subunit b/b'